MASSVRGVGFLNIEEAPPILSDTADGAATSLFIAEKA
jgi:hypothetical protein